MAKPEVEIDIQTAADLRRLRELEREYALLGEEHTLLKKPSGFVPRTFIAAVPGPEDRQGTSSCQVANAYGCLRYFVTVMYQCIGASDSKAAAARTWPSGGKGARSAEGGAFVAD